MSYTSWRAQSRCSTKHVTFCDVFQMQGCVLWVVWQTLFYSLYALLYPHLFILRHSHHLPLNEVDGVSLTCLGISVCSDDLSQTFSRRARHLDCPPFWRRHIQGESQSFRTFLHDNTMLGKDTYAGGQFSPSVLTGSGGAGWTWLSLTFPAPPPGRRPYISATMGWP